MTPVIEFSVEGADRWRRRLVGISRGLRDFRSLGEALTPTVRLHMGEWIDDQGRGTWQALSPRYARWKTANYPGRRMMVLEGDLSASLHGRGEFAVTHISQRGGEWGTRVPFARAHHHGYPDGNLPKRPLMQLNDELRKDVLDVTRRWVSLNLRRGR